MATVKYDKNKLIQSALKQILPSVAKATPRTTNELSQASPNRTGRTAQGWYNTVPRIEGTTLRWDWGNRGENSLQSIVGRGAYTGSTKQTGFADSLIPWVGSTFFLGGQQAVGLAIAIARKINTEGSENFRTGINDLDLERDGTPRVGGIAHQILYDGFIANLRRG